MRHVLARAQQTDRAIVFAESNILTGEECLNAELEVVRQRDFRDRRIDCNLHQRPVDVAKRAFDDPIVFLVGIDHNRIVARVR